MKALRIHLTQSSANYRKEETIQNKMTYPLPPFSTIIGAIHNACGFKEYKEMRISIQGDYKSMGKEAYRDQAFLNTTFEDRGTLVKMANSDCLSSGYIKVASALKKGSSFRKGTDIAVHNEELLEEYRQLKDLNDKIQQEKKEVIKPKIDELKEKRKELSSKKKALDKNSEEYKELDRQDKELKAEIDRITAESKEYEEENFTKPYSRFRTLNGSIKYYEVLYDIELYIHVIAKEEILEAIYNNAYNITSIGRSEDFVDVKEVSYVELEEPDKDYESSFHAYISAEAVEDNGFGASVYRIGNESKHGSQGTKYYIGKNYEVINNKRKFKKLKVYYISNYCVDQESEDVYIDKTGETPLIVEFGKMDKIADN